MRNNFWEINNGLLILSKTDGEIYIPTSLEIYNSRNFDFFIHDNFKYPSLKSALNLNIKLLGLSSTINLTFTDSKIKINLIAKKNNKEYKVGNLNNQFLDYIIIENDWYFINDNILELNSIIEKIVVNLHNVTYLEYFNLQRKLLESTIAFEDIVSEKIKNEKIKNKENTFSNLNAKLYNYQEIGVGWLYKMLMNNCGCILGDDMGLGKTIQIIATLGQIKATKYSKPNFLIVCPVSLLENWHREIDKFLPNLNHIIHYGKNRIGNYTELLKYDIIITSYSNIKSDISMLNMINWDLVILDEAQNIKNPSAQRTKFIKSLNRKCAILVTGTPFENHITDIWSLIDFAIPNFLGSLNEFENIYVDDIVSALKLESIISPLILRRKVNEVAQDLPKKIEIQQPLTMTELEAENYERHRTISINSANPNKLNINDIQKLRMYCTHPFILNDEIPNYDPIEYSNKYNRLIEILTEIFAKNEKAILFTSFSKMIKLLVNDISKRFDIYINFIDGSVEVSKRQIIIDQYSKTTLPSLLILNPRAAGVGLNITAANHVIHYNLEWNPAIEDQASARSFRRGQTKPVFIHRFFYTNTVEEIINQRLISKRELSETAIVGNFGDNDDSYLINALKISPTDK